MYRVLLSFFLFSSTIFAQTNFFDEVIPSVIYGDDDRYDYFEIQEHKYRQAADASLAIIDSEFFEDEGNGWIKIKAERYGVDNELCSEERFFDQPSAPYCSGVLIRPNLVLTAGHCFQSVRDCRASKFIFNYKMAARGSLLERLASSEIYDCAKLYRHNNTKSGDFALVQLDRPVLGHQPASYRSNGGIALGDKVFAVGYPVGLPMKFALNAKVRRVKERS